MVFVYLGILLFFFMAGMPVAFALGISAVLLMIVQQGGTDINYSLIAQRLLYGPNNFILLSVPMFLLAGNLMNTGGVTNRIYRFASAMVGRVRGALGHVNIIASVIFAGMTGTAVSEAAGLGTVQIKAMREAGYEPDFSCAVSGAAATIGPIIPPSVPLVIYGVLASASIGRLLIAGIIPGLLMGGALMAMVAYYANRRNLPRSGRLSFQELGSALIQAFLPLLTPIIILGGIISGVFTPTEAAGIAAVYALILGVGVYREISLRDLWRILHDTARDSAVVLFILAGATLYAWVLIRSRIPILLMEEVTGLTSNPLMILIIINLALLVIGCFMETIAAMNILVPVLAPLLASVGIDPIHFGVVMVLNLMIGTLTPPFGMVLFIMNKVSGVPLEKVIRATMPFLIPLGVVLVLITAYPELVTFLPNLVFGRR
jgi:tripartite ATP-independent transporter DctM subunit